jgi:hypothetical protein
LNKKEQGEGYLDAPKEELEPKKEEEKKEEVYVEDPKFEVLQNKIYRK